jgi:6-phosphogluconolactonase
VANAGTDSVSVYAIDAKSGTLAEIPTSPVAAGESPNSITVDPAGRFVYVGNQESNSLSAFRVDPISGTLSAVSGSPFATGRYPYFVAVAPSGKFVYVTNAGATASLPTRSTTLPGRLR